MKLIARLVLCLAAHAFLAAPAAAQESNEFRVARQPGLVYIQAIIMEEKKLIEKHAAALGVKDLKVRWSIITSGGVMTEALISNSIDMAITGISNDRIAVPTIRASMQAMMMGIALEQAYGLGQHGRLDSNQVQLGHPDAMQALLNPQHEVNSHFSIPPFQDIAMKSPLVHTVLVSTDVLGGVASITNAWSTQRFVEANPLKVKAFIAALDEASDMVMKDTKAAAEIYLAVTKEKITVDELVTVIRQPGAIFSATPQRSMLWAEYMHRIGLIKQKPASWKDYSFPNIHDRNGS
jgi:sulfonate transport system substrate-binding protein